MLQDSSFPVCSHQSVDRDNGQLTILMNTFTAITYDPFTTINSEETCNICCSNSEAYASELLKILE